MNKRLTAARLILDNAFYWDQRALEEHNKRMAKGCLICHSAVPGRVCPDCYVCRACKPGCDECDPVRGK